MQHTDYIGVRRQTLLFESCVNTKFIRNLTRLYEHVLESNFPTRSLFQSLTGQFFFSLIGIYGISFRLRFGGHYLLNNFSLKLDCASGLFFATQMATGEYFTPREYRRYGEPHDLAVLRAAGDAEIIVLHLHGQDVFFDLVNRYPVHAVSWHDRETDPSLAEARAQTRKPFLAGLDRHLLESGPVAEITAQAHDAIAQTDRRGLILAPSCVIPPHTPAEHLSAARQAGE